MTPLWMCSFGREKRTIPTGLNHSAQGCEAHAELPWVNIPIVFTLKGFCRAGLFRHMDNRGMEPLQGSVRLGIIQVRPRCGHPWAELFNPVVIRFAVAICGCCSGHAAV